MKDYLAKEVAFEYWKQILKYVLPENAESIANNIERDNDIEYSRSYAAMNKLIETGKIKNASEMVRNLQTVDEIFAEKFTLAVLEGLYLFRSCYCKFVIPSDDLHLICIHCNRYFHLPLE